MLIKKSLIVQSAAVSNLSSEGKVSVLLFVKHSKKVYLHFKRESPPYY